MPPMRIRTLGKLAFALTLLSVGGCSTGTVLSAGLNCSALISPTLREPTEPAPLPTENTVGALARFADQQTGAFEIAETKRKGVIESLDLCSREQQRLTEPPRWMFWR